MRLASESPLPSAVADLGRGRSLWERLLAATEWTTAGGVYSAKAHSRSKTQTGPAARQAGKEVKREKIEICRTACISRLSRISRSERSEGMRFAPQTSLPPAPEGGSTERAPGSFAEGRIDPHYARDAVARSWRWSCHRKPQGVGPEAYLSVHRKVRDPRTPGRTAISAVAAGGSCIMRVNGCRTFSGGRGGCSL